MERNLDLPILDDLAVKRPARPIARPIGMKYRVQRYGIVEAGHVGTIVEAGHVGTIVEAGHVATESALDI